MNLKLPNLKFKNLKSLIWPLASLFISLCLLIFVILPQIVGYFNNQRDIADLNRRAAFLDSKAASLKKVDTSSYKNNINVALIALPSEKDIPSAVNQIQNLTSANNLQLSGISFVSNELSSGSTNQNFSIKVDLTGSQSSLKSFIDSLRSAPIIMKLTGMEITGNKDGSLQSSLTLTVYYQSSSTTLGDVEQPIPTLTDTELNLLSQLQQNTTSLPTISSNNANSSNLGPRGKTDPFQ